MFVVFKSVMASIRKQKTQTVLVGIVLVLVSSIFFTGLSLITQPKAYKAMYKRAKAAHSQIIMPGYQPIVSEMVNLLNENEQVETIAEYKTLLCGLDTEVDGEKKSVSILLTEFNERDDVDILYIDESEIAGAPEKDEILINYVFAKQMGINVGDTVKITAGDREISLKVADIVVDSQYSNSFISPKRVFVSPDFFINENIHFDIISIFIKYHDPESIDETHFFDNLYRDLNTDTIPVTWQYKDFLMSYSIVQGIISGVFIAVSMLILFIVIFVIRAIISDTIYKKFKQIGIQKAVGYSEKQIMMSIIYKYIFIGGVSSIIGAAIGIFVQQKISQILNADIKAHTTAPICILIPITVLFIVGLLVLFSYTKIKKLQEIKPVQAIKYGIPEMNFEPNTFDMSKRKSSLLFLIAIKDFMKNRKKTIGNILLITFLVFPTLVFYNMSYTVSNKTHFANNLMGMQVGDFAVENAVGNNVKTTYSKIKDIDGVDRLVVMSYENAFDTSSFKRDDGSKQSIMEKVIYGDTDFDFILLKEGRQIETANEIVITSLVAEDSKKSIGDYITIYNSKTSNTYLICGIYDSVESNGYSYIRYENVFPKDSVQSQVIFWVYTNDSDLTLNQLDESIKETFGEAVITSYFDSIVVKIIESMAFLPIVLGAMLLVFIIINLLIVLNFTIIDINSSYKKFGIMKAIGFTKVSIVVILIIKTLITALLGGILALILNFLFAEMLMQMSISMSYSIINLPLVHDVLGCIGLIFVFIVISVLSTLIPTKRIDAVSPRQLISE